MEQSASSRPPTKKQAPTEGALPEVQQHVEQFRKLNCKHSLVNLLAAKTGAGAETETGLDNKSAVAFEKHRIRLRMAAGAWRDYHESIHAHLPFVHSCTADAAVQEDLRAR
jgi:hypothetical protein